MKAKIFSGNTDEVEKQMNIWIDEMWRNYKVFNILHMSQSCSSSSYTHAVTIIYEIK
jgi:hypothetical protein